jgi:hypothetical protein
MNAQSRFKIPPHAVSRAVGDETVILDLASSRYFGLDSVGARIWTLFDEGKSFGETCDMLLGEYEVGRDRLEADLRELVAKLLERQLIEVNEG